MTNFVESMLYQYHYAPLSWLICQTGFRGPEFQRYYCKNRLANEIKGGMRYSIVQHGDQLLAQQRGKGDLLDTTLLTTDQQRSVLHNLKANDLQHSFAVTDLLKAESQACSDSMANVRIP